MVLVLPDLVCELVVAPLSAWHPPSLKRGVLSSVVFFLIIFSSLRGSGSFFLSLSDFVLTTSSSMINSFSLSSLNMRYEFELVMEDRLNMEPSWYFFSCVRCLLVLFLWKWSMHRAKEKKTTSTQMIVVGRFTIMFDFDFIF